MKSNICIHSVVLLVICLIAVGCVQKNRIETSVVPTCEEKLHCGKSVLFSEYKLTEEKRLASSYSQPSRERIRHLFKLWEASWLAADDESLVSFYWPNKSPVTGLSYERWRKQLTESLPTTDAMLRIYDVEFITPIENAKNYQEVRIKRERKTNKVHDFTFMQIGLVRVDDRWIIDTEKVISNTILSLPNVELTSQKPDLVQGEIECSVIENQPVDYIYTVKIMASQQYNRALIIARKLPGKGYLYQSKTGYYIAASGMFINKQSGQEYLKKLKGLKKFPNDIYLTKLKSQYLKKVICL